VLLYKDVVMPYSEMRYCEISIEMSSLYFGLDVCCQFETRVREFGAVFRVQYTLYNPQLLGDAGVACLILGPPPHIGRI
jgi:hypothetical protein